MSGVPDAQRARISYFQTRLAGFAEHAAEIGTTPELVAELAARTEAAREAFAAAARARMAAQTATARLNDAIDAMNVMGQSILKQVHARAAVAGVEVYALASVSAPAEPSPVGPPGTPTGLRVELRTSGELSLRWECKNPARGRGVIYHIDRRDDPAGEFRYLGSAGRRRFVDYTVPPGASQLAYRIRATRSTGAGAAAMFPVNLGVDEAWAKQMATDLLPRDDGNLAAA